MMTMKSDRFHCNIPKRSQNTPLVPLWHYKFIGAVKSNYVCEGLSDDEWYEAIYRWNNKKVHEEVQSSGKAFG